jgi:hypothetical protein
MEGSVIAAFRQIVRVGGGLLAEGDFQLTAERSFFAGANSWSPALSGRGPRPEVLILEV